MNHEVKPEDQDRRKLALDTITHIADVLDTSKGMDADQCKRLASMILLALSAL